MNLESKIQEWAKELDFDQVGIASLYAPMEGISFLTDWVDSQMHAGMSYMADQMPARKDINLVLPGAKTAIVFSASYAQPIEYSKEKIKVARYAQNRDYHNVLRKKLKKIVSNLSISLPHEQFRICVDSAPVMERELAQRAGIGWAGKNTMLINSHRGSYFLISSILTTAILEPSAPAIGGCGTCRACIDACPTGAIVPFKDRWAVDSRQCISYYTIEHKDEIPESVAEKMSDWTFGCDICQEVCPFNQTRESQPDRAKLTPIAEFRSRIHPTHEDLASMTVAEWDEYSQGTPIRRAGRKGMLRNSQINLKNIQKS